MLHNRLFNYLCNANHILTPKMRNLTVEDISPGCVRLRICVEYVIGVYTLTKQAGGFFSRNFTTKVHQSNP